MCLMWNMVMWGELHWSHTALFWRWSRVMVGAPQLHSGQDVRVAFVNVRINGPKLRGGPVKDCWRLVRCSFPPMSVCRSYWQLHARPEQVLGCAKFPMGAQRLGQFSSLRSAQQRHILGKESLENWIDKEEQGAGSCCSNLEKKAMENTLLSAWKTGGCRRNVHLNDAPEAASASDSASVFCSSPLSQGKI